ncbi:hypothetical protein MCC10003_2077 [Bifidobacterium longum subsp. longum]|nr:hypothetical protein MCC10003_2077 [Bifidobacterium longum subsp. longum]
MSNAYERRGAQLNMESLYIRHDVISERKLARLNPDRPVSFSSRSSRKSIWNNAWAMSARPSVIRDS